MAAAFGNSLLARALQPVVRMHRPQRTTTYVLVFLGEFGYELLNWQGVARRFATSLPRDTTLAVAGRAGLQAFYRFANHYIDISECQAFRESVAAAYFAIPSSRTRRSYPQSREEKEFDTALRREIESYVRMRLPADNRGVEFIFSSNLTVFPGSVFGADWKHYGSSGYPGQIYSDMRFLTRNNSYERIEPDATVRGQVEKKLGFSLDQPFVLVQTRSRSIGPSFGAPIDTTRIVGWLVAFSRVVVLSFDTGRRNDSRSLLSGAGHSVTSFAASSFDEQAWLIHAAKRCVFVTEGDLGSHTYLPPLLGRDVHVVASAQVFSQPSAPVELWNKSIFTFGGQMHRVIWEDLHNGSLLGEALALPPASRLQ